MQAVHDILYPGWHPRNARLRSGPATGLKQAIFDPSRPGIEEIASNPLLPRTRVALVRREQFVGAQRSQSAAGGLPSRWRLWSRRARAAPAWHGGSQEAGGRWVSSRSVDLAWGSLRQQERGKVAVLIDDGSRRSARIERAEPLLGRQQLAGRPPALWGEGTEVTVSLLR